MSLIFEISMLDKWKVESKATHKLSMVDLAKCGLDIERHLQQELANLSNKQGPIQSKGSSAIHNIPSRITATKAYALSAIVYLHVVISGPYPNLMQAMEDSRMWVILAAAGT
ncbi:hypothetical protein TSTA_047680 [Talaromyces stipitatus ATCC 10500]|uniref:Uncharacterized protein n=1 Tax=Talaromyces stipitatus (strain ATCC 10500 / CBS 375.48 / QM 6759 / NRRL 1006) TaxID=441959 RepID=B8MKG7_TALSN|nr:uncharacterized protein TSTA_047680 [Talaromyces stipitatus ATCC 10500]EED15322.1 hypothetical protein TSTA_047680 [Talaromyces stipitatus ATCC 10500]